MALAVRDWGMRPYEAALAEMRSLVRDRRAGRIPDTLLLVEHPPVVTVGVEGAGNEVLPDGIPVVPVERGGHATYHGPGQLVGYPIVDLEARGRDVRSFVHAVEEMVVLALAEFDVSAGRVKGRRGVWVEESRKIASVGIAVSSWITFHGFALNVDNDLAPFRFFHPCGLDGSVMTSLAAEAGRAVGVAEVRPSIVRAWHAVFEAPGTGLAGSPGLSASLPTA
ncbi:MAG: lipoyl(octanoyl) transferase LipB [Thermoplasmata archaeon]|nr:lipoyl(octanoyl) transferase LipB [Thermoplasmata archaeon]